MQRAALMVGSEAATNLEQEQKIIFSIQAVLEYLSTTVLISMKSIVQLPQVDTQLSISDTELIY